MQYLYFTGKNAAAVGKAVRFAQNLDAHYQHSLPAYVLLPYNRCIIEICLSLANGCARIGRPDFEPYNESEDIWEAIAPYRERYGCYPERILADKIY